MVGKTAWRWLAGPLGVLLVLGACGGRSGRSANGDVAGGGGAPSDAGPEPAGVCPAFAEVGAFEGCEASCTAHEPEADGFCRTSTSVADCSALCRAAVAGTSRECAACLAEAVSWTAPVSGCNDFECGCSFDFPPSFPAVTAEVCVDACRESAGHQRCLREAAPTPASQGTMPSSRIDLAPFVLDELVLDHDDRSFHAIGSRTGGEPIVGRWSLAGEARWVQPGPQDYQGNDVHEQLVPTSLASSAALSGAVDANDDIPTAIELYSAGAEVLSVPAPNAELLGARPAGGVLAIGGGRVEFLDASLALERSVATELSYSGWRQVLESPAGDLLAISDPGNFCTRATVQRLRLPLAGEPELAWSIEEISADWLALAEAPDGMVLVGGRAQPREPRPCCENTCEPVVRVYTQDGLQGWEYRPEARDISGVVTALAIDAAGNVYAASTEDPVSLSEAERKTELCSVYGCDGMVLRKLSQQGQLLFEYRHREQTSFAKDLALDALGHAYLLGIEAREEKSTILLGFDP